MTRTAVFAGALLAATIAGVALWHGIGPSAAGHSSLAGTAGDAPAQRPFSLIDQHGRPITNDTFRGKWLIVFFGYTSCPDFCPTTLGRVSQTLAKLEAKAQDVRVLFITVDPERDTPEKLERYLQPLRPKFIGGTGSEQQIQAATRVFRTYSRKQPPAPDGSYSVDHSTQLYILGPDGQLVRQLSSQATPDQLATTLRTIMDRHW